MLRQFRQAQPQSSADKCSKPINVGCTLAESFNTTNLVILIDEAEVTYYDAQLWGIIKDFPTDGGPFLVMFAAHGSPTARPVDLDTIIPPERQRISMAWSGDDENEPIGLTLLEAEAYDMVACISKAKAYDIAFEQQLQDELYRMMSVLWLH
jgi:hypothetical protein